LLLAPRSRNQTFTSTSRGCHLPRCGPSVDSVSREDRRSHGGQSLQGSPDLGGYRHVRCARLLNDVSGRGLTHPKTGWVSHPHARTLRSLSAEYASGTGTIQAPHEGAVMSDKSPRQSMSKKSSQTVKQKRAAKRAKPTNQPLLSTCRG